MRIIDQLRRGLGGTWSYDRNMCEWVRDDGVKVYARSHCSINAGGGEDHYTRWYIERPVYGPSAEIRSFPGQLDHYRQMIELRSGRLAPYVESYWPKSSMLFG